MRDLPEVVVENLDAIARRVGDEDAARLRIERAMVELGGASVGNLDDCCGLKHDVLLRHRRVAHAFERPCCDEGVRNYGIRPCATTSTKPSAAQSLDGQTVCRGACVSPRAESYQGDPQIASVVPKGGRIHAPPFGGFCRYAFMPTSPRIGGHGRIIPKILKENQNRSWPLRVSSSNTDHIGIVRMQ